MEPALTTRLAGRRGYTLVELMVSLSIFAFASTAISSLMFATYETKSHIQGTTDATSAAEISMRRIIEVARSAKDISYTDPQTGMFVLTPPDSSNLSYIFIYYQNNNQLREKIETAGSLTLIQDSLLVGDLTSFGVTRVNAGKFPESYQVNLVVNGTPVPISRSVVVTARNLTQ
jgi:prepilin-type N-terminal cleavage/methylation domain-containing protein